MRNRKRKCNDWHGWICKVLLCLFSLQLTDQCKRANADYELLLPEGRLKSEGTDGLLYGDNFKVKIKNYGNCSNDDLDVFKNEIKNFEVDATNGIYAVRFGIQPYDRFTGDGCEIKPWDSSIWEGKDLSGYLRTYARVYYNNYGIYGAEFTDNILGYDVYGLDNPCTPTSASNTSNV